MQRNKRSSEMIILSTVEFRKNFGINLRRFREGRNLSQEQFAEDCGIERSYYGKIELGKHSITIDKCYQIASYLGIPIQELFRDID